MSSDESTNDAELTSNDAAVPPEVVAADTVPTGDPSEEHNVSRPAGKSGTARKRRPAKPKGKPLGELTVGDAFTGTVKNIATFGAFVDFGFECDGLLHISRMSDNFVGDVNDVVEVGKEIEGLIHSIDVEKKQVGLTLKSSIDDGAPGGGGMAGAKGKSRPARSAGDRAAQRASLTALGAAMDKAETPPGFVEGTVSNIMDFGAFVRIDTGAVIEGLTGEVDGLLHISMIDPDERVNDVHDKMSEGDKIQVRAMEVGDGKLSLTCLTVEQCGKVNKKGGDGGKRKGGRDEPRFAANSLGAADWKESMGSFEQPEFGNSFVLVE